MYPTIVKDIHYNNPANQSINYLQRNYRNTSVSPVLEQTKNLMQTLQTQEFDWAIRVKENTILKNSSLWTWIFTNIGYQTIPSVPQNLTSLIEANQKNQQNNIETLHKSQQLPAEKLRDIENENLRISDNCVINTSNQLSVNDHSRLQQFNNAISTHSETVAKLNQSKRFYNGMYISAAAVGALGIGTYLYSRKT